MSTKTPRTMIQTQMKEQTICKKKKDFLSISSTDGVQSHLPVVIGSIRAFIWRFYSADVIPILSFGD